ncbi:AAA family ATPase [Schaedlerella arabinosiphila]|jgi:hypothetical protein|uniref:AAA family ATPase n=1 Tax=Schaedlerella arabinosiphila TaxID=2044587 RepID=A0A426DLR5_9FIRM|nr:AAA family ATPase [Schaedlerella arabinosiphila]RRK33700.1 AAA family ATPase [Schaedlerella arabinosiphila]
MGIFVNPNNSAFQVALNSEIYVDKTQLLSYTNKVLGTKEGFICNSRPRRFGKSTTADMLAAYYSRGCDSEKMFEGLEISRDSDFYTHLNRYEVIRIDVQWCRTSAKSAAATVTYIEENIIRELQEIYQKVPLPDSLPDSLAAVNKVTGQKFIIIIDEWDCLIRDEAENTELLEEYITLLRGLFKGSTPTEFIHLAYLTGILPIKKIKTQSALNNFDEFTMLDAGILAPYVGFTEKEVEALCEKYSKDFKEVKHWYDGYFLQKEHIYNPKAVVSVMMRGNFKSYWSLTGTYESILPLISMDFDGLKTDIIKMLSGDSVKVEVDSFQNDMVTFQDKDDVLTLLIHLGYLAYDETKETAFIPNEEIRSEFSKATRRKKWNELTELYVRSNELLQSTLDMDSNAVAELIERFHMDYTSALQYNNENSLSSVLSIAYLSAMQYYFKPVREMPAGRGFADLVFLPKKEYPELPALLMELKWNKSAEGAIRQVKERKYVKTLENYTGEILLIGINYSKKEKRHQCVIEKR